MGKRPSKPYDELRGGSGSAVRYRPERFRVKEVLGRYKLTLYVDEQPAHEVENVTMNGLAFLIVAPMRDFVAEQEVRIRLTIEDEPAYTGSGRVVRAPEQAGPDKLRVAVQLTTGFVDVDGLVDRHDDIAMTKDLDGGASRERRDIPSEYRDAVAEAAHFLQYYRAVLGRHEARLKVSDPSGAKVETLAEEALMKLRGPWLEIRARLAATARPHIGPTGGGASANPTVLPGYGLAHAMKAYTQTALTGLLLDAPMVDRGYNKPLGYEGDYQEMIYVYRDALEGPSVFARVFHKLGCEEPLAAGVRTRKELIKQLHCQEHARVLDRSQGAQPFRVTSLACGPALEVQEFIKEQDAWPGRVSWTLIDQEQKALSLAYRETHRALASAPGKAADVRCLFLAFQAFLDNPEIDAEPGSRELIYAAGLFDYLRDHQAKRLLASLVRQLAPGGLLAVGNARVDDSQWWFPEFVLDWSLRYRTREDMRKLAARIDGLAGVDVVLEPSEGYYFLLLRRAE